MSESQTAEGGHGDTGSLTHPLRIGPEFGLDPQFVDLGLVARAAPGPSAEAVVEEPVLDVLGDLARDERRAGRPLVEPPAALADHVVDDVHRRGGVHSADGEVVHDERAR